MVELASGGVYFSGLGNGTDFSKIIDQLKSLEEIPQKRLTLWKADWQKRQDAFGELRTEIAALKDSVDSMNTMEKFMVKTATSSNEAVASATTTSSVLEGSYKIEVGQLASSSIWTYNTAFADKKTTVNSSGSDQQFVYTYMGKTRSITVPSGTTIDGLKNMINNDPQNPGVKAMLVQNGTGYTFQFRGMDMGSTATLSVGAGTTVTGLPATPANWTVQANQNAQYRVNGWPSTTWLESNSNTLTGAVEGMNITLRDVGTSQISVVTDIEKIKENIVGFVDAMNAVRSKIKELTSVNSSKDVTSPDKAASLYSMQKGSILTGNYGVQLLSTQLKTATADKAAGFEYQYKDGNLLRGDVFSSLSHIGIMTIAETNSPNSGLLEIREEDLGDGLPSLDRALRENPEAVAELFAADGLPVSDSSDFSYYSHVKGVTKAGTYDVTYDVDASGNITNAYVGGQRANVDNVNKQITAMEGDARGLALQIDNLAAGSYSSRMRIKEGKLSGLSDQLKDMMSEEGALKILEDNYQDIMDDIQDKIDKEVDRVTQWEQRERLRFSRLEATLARYDALNKSVESQIKSLSSSSS
ncbi:flagellar filament capping protein FliD [Nitratidesulfovibrio sp. HK-II]|uniref:flagellar filament capping protein FliD n=1 Tax=Nitratidesulfovibrio sp. HK-II TaxID=2009266 RepID=UPI000E2EBC41|nr:flagellar filament capping protein FliD [Nitratidesulfovibrio sp. HK-II]GBO96680.1 flagellar hook-associated protein FliD [Nitratidesulfovibrio sp. HK-II]